MSRSPRSFALLYVLPTLLLLVAATLPLISGTETLFLRDLFNAHLEMKWVQAEAMRAGSLPLVDHLRAGGQPHLGNPNTVPLYPDNLLYLVAPFFWAFNAHFWLHLLLAPVSFYALARAWGLAREPAWAAGVLYVASGFFLSNLNFYNLIGGVTVAPALVAAVLLLTARASAGRFVATALLWALMILAGDPMTAALTALLAAAAVTAREGWRGTIGVPVAGAFAAGTLLAAPQIVELLRIVSMSFRGHWGYSPTAAMAASWNPAAALGWLIPFPFGQPDLEFWGHGVFQGHLPFYLSLYPGALALALVAASGKPTSAAARWAWGTGAAGLFFALGSFNPLVRWLADILPANLLRLPAKLWPAVAMAAAILAGLGFQRLLAGKRTVGRRLLPGLALFYLLAGAGLWLAARPAARGLRGLVPPRFDDAFVARILGHWILLFLATAVLLALLAVLARAAWRWPRPAGAAILALHLATQLLLLRPLLATDRTEVYRRPPPMAAHLTSGARVVHGSHDSLFGPATIPVGSFPDARLLWRQRQMHAELFPASGMLQGLRYEFNLSPEGLDGFLTRAAAQAFGILADADRVRLLAASGVDYLLLAREPEPEALALLEPVHVEPAPGGLLRFFRVRGTAPSVVFVGTVYGSDNLNEALDRIRRPEFDPRTAVVLAGRRAPTSGPAGETRILATGPESLEVRVEAEGAGALVVQRAFLPLYRATVDGQPVPLVAANLHRIAVELPGGSHRVRIWADRRPLYLSALLALAGVLVIVATALRLRAARAPAAAG